MKRKIVFTIKEKRNTKRFDLEKDIDVPENWDGMNEDEKRNWLCNPIITYESGGKTLHTSSPFQRYVCEYDIYDFWFCDAPNKSFQPTLRRKRGSKSKARFGLRG